MTRAGWSAGRSQIRLRIRLRICRAKCGVEAPISCRMSSTVGSRTIRSGGSYSLMGRTLPGRGLVDRDKRRGGVHTVLGFGRERVRPAQDPDVVVDALRRVAVLEAG